MAALNLQIVDYADDAQEFSVGNEFFCTFDDAHIAVMSSTSPSARYHGGWRFQNVTIPQGAYIANATLKLFVDVDKNDDHVNATLYCHDVDDSDNFSVLNEIYRRPRTSASVWWYATGLGTGWVNAPDVSVLIQEIIDRPGWSSGNDLSVLAIASVADERLLALDAYDSAPANAARLEIIYYPKIDLPAGIGSAIAGVLPDGLTIGQTTRWPPAASAIAMPILDLSDGSELTIGICAALLAAPPAYPNFEIVLAPIASLPGVLQTPSASAIVGVKIADSPVGSTMAMHGGIAAFAVDVAMLPAGAVQHSPPVTFQIGRIDIMMPIALATGGPACAIDLWTNVQTDPAAAAIMDQSLTVRAGSIEFANPAPLVWAASAGLLSAGVDLPIDLMASTISARSADVIVGSYVIDPPAGLLLASTADAVTVGADLIDPPAGLLLDSPADVATIGADLIDPPAASTVSAAGSPIIAGTTATAPPAALIIAAFDFDVGAIHVDGSIGFRYELPDDRAWFALPDDRAWYVLPDDRAWYSPSD